jgi:hypothetical protein
LDKILDGVDNLQLLLDDARSDVRLEYVPS